MGMATVLGLEMAGILILTVGCGLVRFGQCNGRGGEEGR